MEKNTEILRYFGGTVNKALHAASGEICEIRMRTGRPLAVTLTDKTAFLCEDGSFTGNSEKAVQITFEDIRRSFEAVCRYSVHSCQNQINNGFVTVGGGHRVGLCGTAVYSSDGRIENIKYINGINFRIAREILGSADIIMNRVMNGTPKSILICGVPGSGKTTVLRDLCRQMGNLYPVSLIDERGEIAAENGVHAHNDVGMCTDVFSGFSKADGINRAVRAMSPRMIFCDEIGSDADLDALENAARCGISTAATLHCSSPEQLLYRTRLSRMITGGVFEYCVFVRDRKISEIICRDELSVRKGER